MHRHDRHQPVTGAAVEVVEERQVLEEVRVQPAGDEQVVGFVEALEDLDLQVDVTRCQRLRGRSRGSPRAAQGWRRPATAACPWWPTARTELLTARRLPTLGEPQAQPISECVQLLQRMTHGDSRCGVAQHVTSMVRGIHQHSSKDGIDVRNHRHPRDIGEHHRPGTPASRATSASPSIVFMVVAAAAPLGVIGGVVPLGSRRATAQGSRRHSSSRR